MIKTILNFISNSQNIYLELKSEIAKLWEEIEENSKNVESSAPRKTQTIALRRQKDDDGSSETSEEEPEVDSSKILKLVKEWVDAKIEDFDLESTLHLDLANKKHVDFIYGCRGISVPHFKGVYLCCTHDQKLKNDYDKAFILMTKNPDETLRFFRDGIQNLIQNAREQVYLDTFALNDKSFQFIIENWYKVKKLILRAWEVHLTHSFSVKLTINYHIEEINLFGTWDSKDEDYMTEDKLKIFVAAIASTTLRKSLGIVRVWDNFFPAKIAQAIFNKYKFSLEAIGEQTLLRRIE